MGFGNPWFGDDDSPRSGLSRPAWEKRVPGSEYIPVNRVVNFGRQGTPLAKLTNESAVEYCRSYVKGMGLTDPRRKAGEEAVEMAAMAIGSPEEGEFVEELRTLIAGYAKRYVFHVPRQLKAWLRA